MPQLLPVSTHEMVQEVERELRLRIRIYPKHIARGVLSQPTAERRIEIMEAVLDWVRERPTNGF
jgi:hypothetical protein